MREIKFRAFDDPNNAMVYSDKEDCFYVNTKGVLFMYAVPNTDKDIYHKDYNVMQYTGLKDKNGKEIYGGDIVRYVEPEYDFDFKDSVVFKDGSFCFKSHKFWKDGVHDWYSLENAYSDDIEVIGNIYENPELLEQSDE